MKKLLFILLLIALIFYFLNKNDNGSGLIYQDDGETVNIEKDQHRVTLKKTGSIEGSYRVFGLTKQDEGSRALINHISYTILMTPLDRTRELWAKEQCEAGALSEAVTMSVIIPKEEILNKIREYEKKSFADDAGHFSLYIEGDMVKLKELYIKEEKIELNTIMGNSDIFFNSLVIQDLEEVMW